MKKGSKEMLRTILSNQELIMKALKIEVPVKPTNSVKSAGKPAVAPARPSGGKTAKSSVRSKARKPAKAARPASGKTAAK